MSWHTPRLWATGEFWTAALVNEQLRENMIALTPIVGELKMFVQAATSYERVIGVNWLECNGALVSRSTYSDLYALFNSLRYSKGSGSTTLSAAMTSTQTTVSLVAWPAWPGNGSFPAGEYEIVVDSEVMLVTARAGLVFTVVRAREGTEAVSHNAGATASLYPDLPFGSGDGLSSMALPDLHGRVPYGLIRSGGNFDLSYLGQSDGTSLADRRPKHRHSVSLNGSFHVGNNGYGSGSTTIDGSQWQSPNFAVAVGPQSVSPVDTPPYLAAGVWGIRFVG